MHEFYVNPLCTRYADEEMQRIFSEQRRFSTWRRLWLLLAESEQALGVPITDGQLEEMRAHLDDVDFEAAERYERKVRHDVMAHVLAFGDQCPGARPIIHLGATSCYVGDNTDILNLRDALLLVRRLLLNAMDALAEQAERYKGVPTLAYTHFQAAQPTTVGKRICLWLNDLLFDLRQLDFQLAELRPLGCKGTTGTAASFLELFDGDAERRRSWIRGSRKGWASRAPSGSAARPTTAKRTTPCCRPSPASPRARPNSPGTCGCCATRRSWTSPSSPGRSAPQPWPTSAIPCGRSAWRPWPGT